MKRNFLALGLVLACLGGAALAQAGLTQAQVRATLEAQGYTKVNDVKFEDGVWKADARSADGNRVDVRIDAETGEIFPDEQVANLTEADVRARLATAGYIHVHDVGYEDGIWNAEADDPQGRDVELKIDPKTGKVIGKEKDRRPGPMPTEKQKPRNCGAFVCPRIRLSGAAGCPR